MADTRSSIHLTGVFPRNQVNALVGRRQCQTGSLLCIYASGLEVLHVYATRALGLTSCNWGQLEQLKDKQSLGDA